MPYTQIGDSVKYDLAETKVKTFFEKLLSVPSTDPDDVRRGKNLNILLMGTGAASLIALIAALMTSGSFEGNDLIVLASTFMIAGIIIVYLIGRYWSRKIAATLFLSVLMIALSFSDTPEELSSGRSLFIFIIPIATSSLVLQPVSSFFFAGLGSIIVTILAMSVSIFPNVPAIAAFFLIALVSWLSSRSLEQTLKELRQINAELDHRVEDRTRELSAALARELAEAGKSRAILQGIADGVAVFDPNGISIVANPALGYLLGIRTNQLMGATMETILQSGNVSPQDQGSVLAMLNNPNLDYPSLRLRWGERTLLVNAAQVTSGTGALIGTVAVFRDFTREAEVERMKSTFVGMVSHELRTPLNAIIGYAEMMRESVYGPIAPRQTGIMERIENSSRRLLSLVSDLLDQAQLEAGRMKIHNAEFKVAELLDTVHTQMDKQITDKGLVFTTDLDPGMPAVVMGDMHRLQQLFLNLIGNAAKFTANGGISVRVYRVDAQRWGFSVADTGIGIAPESQQYIFESFRQVENVTTREHGGTGLGLSIVKKLVELMRGEIVLDSNVGAGSKFSIILPLETKEGSL
jgi:signal transduction histidine kinase